MRNSNHIVDEAFKNKLDNYEVAPPPSVWNRVSDSMGYQRRKRRMLIIWTMSGAATLAFAFVMGWLLANRSISNEHFYAEFNMEQTKANQKVILSSPIEQIINIHFDKPQFKQLYASADRNEQIIKSEEFVRKNVELHLMSPVEPSLLFYEGLYSGLVNLNQKGLSEHDRAIIDANLLSMNTNDDRVSHEGRWTIGMQAAPVYLFDKPEFNTKDYAEASSVFGVVQNGVSTNYSTTIAGGVELAYKAHKRLMLITGLKYNEVAQNAGDIGVSFAGHNWLNEGLDYAWSNEAPGASATETETNNVILNTQLGFANILMPSGVQLAVAERMSSNAIEVAHNYDFKQAARYIEVPFLMRYQLTEKRLGLHLLGGMSTNILVSNLVELANQNEVIATGTIEGLSPIVFSSSLGMGFDYAISKRFNFNFEPTLKINLNSLNTQSGYNVKPYTLGVFSGISYQF